MDMKMLNQIIIEGILKSIPILNTEPGNIKVASAFLENSDGAFKIEAIGNLGGMFKEFGKPDSRIRVVGKLCAKYGVAYILAEHIEFKD